MPIRTEDQAKVELEPHFMALRELVAEAHADFREQCRNIAHVLELGTRAAIYRDLIVRKLRAYCDVTTGAQFLRKDQLCLVGLENNWLVRVKRLRNGFAVGVSPTLASEQYDANELPDYAISLLPDAPAATLLYLGWAVPENAPGEIESYLVCNDGNRAVLWAIKLSDPAPSRGIQEPLPIDDGGNEEPRRVTLKGSAKRRANG